MRVGFRLGELSGSNSFPASKYYHQSKPQTDAVARLIVQPAIGAKGRNHPNPRKGVADWGPGPEGNFRV